MNKRSVFNIKQNNILHAYQLIGSLFTYTCTKTNTEQQDDLDRVSIG